MKRQKHGDKRQRIARGSSTQPLLFSRGDAVVSVFVECLKDHFV